MIHQQDPVEERDASMLGVPRFFRLEPPIHIDGADPLYETLDADLLNDDVARAVIDRFGSLDLYRHQTRMLTHMLGGGNGLLTTGTNSGKSDVFIITALDLIKTDPNARVLVLYPSKALNLDQTGRWEEWIRRVGLPATTLARIDGNTPRGERAGLLEKSRVLMTTPDVFQAWFLSEIGNSETHRAFLRHMSLRIIDELHAFGGVFGTNVMHMLRRADYHQSRLNPRYNPRAHRRYLAASGTLSEPESFFEKLTGVSALHIGEDQSGAPRHGKEIWHVGMKPDHLIDYLFEHFNPALNDRQIVLFADSLIAIEELANTIKTKCAREQGWTDPYSVIAYKAGLTPADYRHMHDAIMTNRARVIVASSALEMGVDAPHLDVCIQLGVPRDLSSWMQRIGRVGRRKPSTVFLLNEDRGIAHVPRVQGVPHPHPLFAWMQQGFAKIPIIYPANMPLQLASAFCFNAERVALDPYYANKKSPVVFPKGFAMAMETIKDPYASLDESLHYLIPRARQMRTPHYAFPLRSVPGPTFHLIERSGIKELPAGTTSASAAIRQFTPGLITRHRGTRYRVARWEEDTQFGHNKIILIPYGGQNRTKSYHSTHATLVMNERHILGSSIDGSPLSFAAKTPFIARLRGAVRLTTKGFVEIARTADGRQAVYPYRYLDDHQLEQVQKIRSEEGIDYGPRRHLETPTAGVLLHIPEQWFGVAAREELGRLIADEYCRRHSIHPSDIQVLAKNTRVVCGAGLKIDDHNLFLYESEAGGIGLLNWLPDQLRSILRTVREQTLIDHDKTVPGSYDQIELKRRADRITRMIKTIGGLTSIPVADLQKHFAEAATFDSLEMPEGYMPVFAPGDLIRRKSHGSIETHYQILVPGISPVDGSAGYFVRSVDRKKFYGQSGRWVTIKKGMSSSEFTLKQLEISEDEKKRTLGRHFVSAASLSTVLHRPRMAMDMRTGRLYTINREEDDRAGLTRFEPEGDVRILYEQVIRPNA